MNGLSPFVVIFILVIAFVAGYAGISFVIKKFREARGDPRDDDDVRG